MAEFKAFNYQRPLELERSFERLVRSVEFTQGRGSRARHGTVDLDLSSVLDVHVVIDGLLLQHRLEFDHGQRLRPTGDRLAAQEPDAR